MTQYFNEKLLTLSDFNITNEKITSKNSTLFHDEKLQNLNDYMYNINRHYFSLISKNITAKNSLPLFNNNYQVYNKINSKLIKSIKFLNNTGKRNHLVLKNDKYELDDFIFNNMYQYKSLYNIRNELFEFDFNDNSQTPNCEDEIKLNENRIEHLFEEFYDLIKNNNIKKKFTKIFKSLHKFIYTYYDNKKEGLEDYKIYFKEISDELEKYGFNIRVIFNKILNLNIPKENIEKNASLDFIFNGKKDTTFYEKHLNIDFSKLQLESKQHYDIFKIISDLNKDTLLSSELSSEIDDLFYYHLSRNQHYSIPDLDLFNEILTESQPINVLELEKIKNNIMKNKPLKQPIVEKTVKNIESNHFSNLFNFNFNDNYEDNLLNQKNKLEFSLNNTFDESFKTRVSNLLFRINSEIYNNKLERNEHNIKIIKNHKVNDLSITYNKFQNLSSLSITELLNIYYKCYGKFLKENDYVNTKEFRRSLISGIREFANNNSMFGFEYFKKKENISCDKRILEKLYHFHLMYIDKLYYQKINFYLDMLYLKIKFVKNLKKLLEIDNFDLNLCTEEQCHDVTHPCSQLEITKEKCDSFNDFNIESCTEEQCHDVTHPCTQLEIAKEKCDSFNLYNNLNGGSNQNHVLYSNIVKKIIKIDSDITSKKDQIEEINVEIEKVLDFNDYLEELSLKKKELNDKFLLNQLTKINILFFYS